MVASCALSNRRQRMNRRQRSQVMMEALEPRQLLSLLGVATQLTTPPIISFATTNTAALSYLAGSFSGTTRLTGSNPPSGVVVPPGTITFSIHVDNLGHLTGSPTSTDLKVTDTTGTLLIGRIEDFGFQFDSSSTAEFDFRFQPTGGSLASSFAGKDIGVAFTIDSTPSNLTLGFSTAFQGNFKGSLGGIASLPVIVGNFVWNDLNANGLQDAGEAGINGVSLTLTGTTSAGVAVTDHVVTSGNGGYLFTEAPGTYTVTVDAANAALVGFASTTVNASGSTTANDSNPNPSTTQPLTLTSGSSDLTADFGYVQKVTVGDFVWNDGNGNGIQDAGEAGINGVSLTLQGTTFAGLAVTDHTVTAGNGGYLFTEAPGTYTVTVDTANTALVGFTATTVNAPGSTQPNDSNANPSATQPTALLNGGSDLTLDFGYYKPVSVGDYVWNDLNGDGMQNDGNAGINGVTVDLLDSLGNLIATTTTINNPVGGTLGYYQFSNLAPGTYKTRVDDSNFTGTGALVGFTACLSLQGGNPELDSNGPVATSAALTSGQSDETLDFGYYKPVSVGDYVWNDLNADGIQNDGNTGINGVTVDLLNESDVVIATTTTINNPADGAAGYYQFSNLAPGTYKTQVDVTNPLLVGYTASPAGQGLSEALDSNGPVATSAQLSSGQSDETLDFGYYMPVTIGDFVWNDSNANGIQDAGEAGIAGVKVNLSNGDSTTTDANGHYLFTENPGTYTVTVDTSTLPAGYFASPTLVGGDTAKDSNVNGGGTTPSFLPGGSSDLTVDFGYFQKVAIGDFVWNDLNANGIQDVGEPGIAGVKVNLSNGDSTTTDVNGHYSFTENPGAYTVTVDTSTLPAGFFASPTLQGGDTSQDSNVNGGGTTPSFLPGGSSDLTVDFGYFQKVAIGDFVWNDLNANGIQDVGEPGIAGVKLTLSNGDTANTDSTGHYLFTENPGTYTVTVDTSTLPAGFFASPTLVGGDTAKDSNANGSATNPATLPGGGSDLTLDFGYYQNVTIGNYVWNDANFNGVQDSGEPGIAGVSLTINGTDGAGNPVTQTTVTDANGQYSFTEAPGTYSVTVTTPAGYVPTVTGKGTTATDSNGTPSGTTPSFLPGGSSDQTLDFGFYKVVTIGNYVWNDANFNGVQDGTETGIGGVSLTLTGTNGAGVLVTDHAVTNASGGYLFTEAPGTYTVTVDASNTALGGYTATVTGKGTSATDSNVNPSGTSPATLPGGGSDLTLDFGYYQNVTIGNYVWNDANFNGVQDSGEAGIAGVSLTITGTDGAGNPVTQTTVTDATGQYSFTEAPGTYSVTVTTPAGYVPTVTGKGTTATDSNGTPSGTTPSFLPGGSSDQTLDFGFYKVVTIGNYVWNDANFNGVQDGTETGIGGVSLTLTGTNGAGVAVTDHAVTNASGGYLFTEAPGTYTVTVDASNTALTSYTATVTGKGTTATDSNAQPAATTPNALPGGSSDLTLDFGYFKKVTVGDFVWNDTNANGVQDSGETGINGVALTLTGTNGAGQAVTDHATTSGNGGYLFTETPGTYTVTVDASNFATGGVLAAFLVSPTLVGGNRAVDSNVSPSSTNPSFLPGGNSDLTLDFGYYQKFTITLNTIPGASTSTLIGAGQFATIGFWHNQNGQAVIKGFNGSSTSTALGNWLAATYPNLFGNANNIYTHTSLAGMTNAQVANVYLNLWTPSGVNKNTYVQAFAVALGLYADTTSLGGASLIANGMATQFGFVVTASGAGSYNVGNNGSNLGFTNNTAVPVSSILGAVNTSFAPSTGTFFSGSQTNTSAANNVLDCINTYGDIPGSGILITSGNKLFDSAIITGGADPTGSITFYLFAPGASSATPLSDAVYSDTVPVNGNATYDTNTGTNPGGFTPTVPGTYQWVAVYSGDANNNPVTGHFGDEPWTVGNASVTINTIDGGTVVAGNALTDLADLEGGNPSHGIHHLQPICAYGYQLCQPGVHQDRLGERRRDLWRALCGFVCSHGAGHLSMGGHL